MEQNKYEIIFEGFLECIDFGLIKIKGTNRWRLKDLQGANLGNIECDTFKTIDEIIDRLNIYINDFCIERLDNEISEDDMPKSFYTLSNKEIIKWYTPKMQVTYPEVKYIINILDAFVHSEKINLDNICHECEVLDLPQNIILNDKVFSEDTISSITEDINEYLSSEYGFCTHSYGYDIKVEVNCIDWDLEE